MRPFHRADFRAGKGVTGRIVREMVLELSTRDFRPRKFMILDCGVYAREVKLHFGLSSILRSDTAVVARPVCD